MTNQPTAPPGTSEESQITELLREQTWDSVAAWKVETGEDPFGDPAIRVWVILERSREFKQRNEIRKRVRETIVGSGEQRWVYIRFRTRQEQEDLDKLERQEALEEDREESA